MNNDKLHNLRGMEKQWNQELLRKASRSTGSIPTPTGSPPGMETSRLASRSVDAITPKGERVEIDINWGDKGEWTFNVVKGRGNLYFEIRKEIEAEGVDALIDRLARVNAKDAGAIAAEDLLIFFSLPGAPMSRTEFVSALLKREIEIEEERGKGQGNQDSLLREPSFATEVFHVFQDQEMKMKWTAAAQDCVDKMVKYASKLPLEATGRDEQTDGEKLSLLFAMSELFLGKLEKEVIPNDLKAVLTSIYDECVAKFGHKVAREQLVGLYLLRGVNSFLISRFPPEEVNLYRSFVNLSKIIQWSAGESDDVKIGRYMPLFTPELREKRRGEIDRILGNLISTPLSGPVSQDQ